MHHCPSLPLQDGVMQEKMSATKKQLLPPAFSLPKRKPPKDPIKLAQWQKVEAMKMRHRASPADPKDKAASLPPDQRLHVRVTLGDAEKIFWVRKTVITGRALDLLALHFIPASLSNSNDLLLEKQIKDGESLAIRSL
ncbi:unnamed protein product [Cyclocybe aegerita]|uniref:Uncharacterized protein n=1 Tax=Cyclocybe aegerita TaxID=1973307 RepID=A0A8S0X842_CYCAE|nr:unnamed protein product [Cyclocybe aegerita]